jgi:hypothetical protein
MEKVIHEWRIVETDDGFRIEIKGDKEAMRDWMEHFESGGRRRWAHHRRPFGHWGAHFWHHVPWCCTDDEEEAEEEEAA